MRIAGLPGEPFERPRDTRQFERARVTFTDQQLVQRLGGQLLFAAGPVPRLREPRLDARPDLLPDRPRTGPGLT
jgi:hypothetical protein